MREEEEEEGHSPNLVCGVINSPNGRGEEGWFVVTSIYVLLVTKMRILHIQCVCISFSTPYSISRTVCCNEVQYHVFSAR